MTIQDPDFVTATYGVGYDFAGGIATTTNSGATWTAVASTVPDNLDYDVGLHFSSPQVGYLAGAYTEDPSRYNSGGQLERTIDGGRT